MSSIIPRLRPLLRATIPFRAARFHAISAHYAEPRQIPFLPLFLQPSTYRPNYNKNAGGVQKDGDRKTKGPKPWNPATFFIWIFLMIGSQAIQQLTLKQEHADFLRKADGRIAVLREVIERLGRGEEVDVERMLGTGEDAEEKAWEEVIKEIEADDVLWQAQKLQKEAAAKQAEIRRLAEEEQGEEVVREGRRKRRRAREEARFL
ncbi:hypothetical protein BZA05DRAFT_386545 [Tricharina praecox]|uniref:uncharacterized protein n=1 Tax=Tricharina praecox TaxID=43433 RepID=UPI00221E946C|nr:uncharacterized protein BZA05DRAFT_386545 [Tricharina praecox]KAI5856907.1 hypothetical protein BZA05DRAFT_386545 [Tricharina praecox]